MSGAPVISVVIPCYNGAATVAQTIESALDQAPPMEVIVVDDGSTDDSAAVLRRFGDRIVARFGPNRGASAARNTAASLVRGDWVCFLDADDLIAPGSFVQRLAAAARTGADVVICDWEDFEDGGGSAQPRRIEPAKLEGDVEQAIADGLWAPPAAVLYRRDMIEAIGGFREDLPVIQDARYLFDAAHSGGRFVHDAHLGARYRVLPGSLSRRSPAKFWYDVFRNGRQIEAIWTDAGAFDAARRQTIVGIYDQVARGLFAIDDPKFAEAVAEMRRLGGGSRYSLTADRLSSIVGRTWARRALALVGR